VLYLAPGRPNPCKTHNFGHRKEHCRLLQKMINPTCRKKQQCCLQKAVFPGADFPQENKEIGIKIAR